MIEVGAVEEAGAGAEGGSEESGAGGGSGCLPRTLETLRLSGNDLSGPGALTGLFRSRGEGGGRGGGGAESSERASENNSSGSSPSSLLPLLSTLDLSHCSIANPETVLALLESLPSLRALYLQGNPFWDSKGATATKGNGGVGGVGGFVNCRRLAVLAAAPLCTYLNDSPVFGDERAAADAFRESGGSFEAATAARGRFLEAAALEAERTTRFVRLAEEEQGDEEPDQLDSDDDEKEEGGSEGAEYRARTGAEGCCGAAATATEKDGEEEVEA